MNQKIHYKMYKSGKAWLFAGIVLTSVSLGLSMSTTTHAATDTSGQDATLVSTTTSTAPTIDNTPSNNISPEPASNPSSITAASQTGPQVNPDVTATPAPHPTPSATTPTPVDSTIDSAVTSSIDWTDWQKQANYTYSAGVEQDISLTATHVKISNVGISAYTPGDTVGQAHLSMIDAKVGDFSDPDHPVFQTLQQLGITDPSQLTNVTLTWPDGSVHPLTSGIFFYAGDDLSHSVPADQATGIYFTLNPGQDFSYVGPAGIDGTATAGLNINNGQALYQLDWDWNATLPSVSKIVESPGGFYDIPQVVKVQYRDAATGNVLKPEDILGSNGHLNDSVTATAPATLTVNQINYAYSQTQILTHAMDSSASSLLSNTFSTEQNVTATLPSARLNGPQEQIIYWYNTMPNITNSTTITANQTIHYVYTDHSQAAPDYTNELSFTHTIVNDPITNEVISDTWTPTAGDDFSAVMSPTISGFTPDKTEVAAVQNVLAAVKAGQVSFETAVTYTAIPAPINSTNPDNPTTPTSNTATEEQTSTTPSGSMDYPASSTSHPKGQTAVGKNTRPDTVTNPTGKLSANQLRSQKELVSRSTSLGAASSQITPASSSISLPQTDEASSQPLQTVGTILLTIIGATLAGFGFKRKAKH